LGWAEVWKHQLRWARTIRVCQPAPYFFSILSNATLWPLMWLAARPSWFTLWVALGCWFVRMFASRDLQRKLAQGFRVQCSGAAPAADNSKLETPNSKLSVPVWFALLKDLLQVPLWLLAFAGNTIEWRGQRLRLRRDGTLERVGS
jgi:ceramide glucosyltransferase